MSSKHRVGLIFGKFYPLHSGHIYLIEKALTQVDELHVMLGCEATRDKQLFEKSRLPRQPQVSDRFSWLKDTFKDRHNIHIYISDETGINYYPNGWKEWSDSIKHILSENKIEPSVVFTSEPQDVTEHERYFGCPVVVIDANREFVNISATKIRENPYQNWSFIAQAARPFFVKKVAIIGHDKFNELPLKLANIYNTQYVSNGYINYIQREISTLENKRYLSENDYLRIAMLHVERMSKSLENANKLLFTSIDFGTLSNYYEQIFGKSNEVLIGLKSSYQFDLIIHENELPANSTPLQHFEIVSKMVESLLI
ncbi:multifunctional transcriptional regulator/nicotinamide-nucleotide adenylyltransferase/ribosylnicotinamide kinase NadR [Gilliamella sp. B3023]|uniref:multifunctional transcriptional regulator/nicotinamide-nucleotide adenylyltransferase/ribosylnicotinamide kinase NadR n=1 Tax=unclassified Gilliamella TaxID=2685620 RepID=UPI00226A2E60|nr:MULTISPECIES: multifunctional transcriptional regulator/nicotinamide-nucleotide adenylyltransferase/ribosylnicotinamide kinase NadR [unclassified Gilliamella]MCX8585534.1 multifunctional transcriptional regulator/nicotinamide-nucleotide adenylyltransferase/ribosylnicotinamide kinase NadR [Gilliamella sp. B3562]MCX8674255.1 multifunctional transcriptional regulator/nicotinamide-nucleotide adenylyltransferase/ribosylnicotinamide kinase NadR [Gilliamella sp. B3023]MCX8685445.1 multifunctional tr